nr:hypothetical protein [Tanacetum cinerariifolium]
MRTTDRRHVNLTASTPDHAIQYDLGPFAMRGGQGRGRGAMLGPEPGRGGGMLGPGRGGALRVPAPS